MKREKLTTEEKKSLAIKAFRSVAQKADSYPTWMQSYFNNDLDAYNNAYNKAVIS